MMDKINLGQAYMYLQNVIPTEKRSTIIIINRTRRNARDKVEFLLGWNFFKLLFFFLS